jgi:hypothetical protein
MATQQIPTKVEKFQEATDVKTTPVAAPSESAGPVRILSSEDSVVADLVKETKSLGEIENMTMSSPAVHNPLELPDECLKLQRVKYRYKWMNKNRELATKLRTQGWSLCNRTTAPYIKPHRFGAHGAVEQAGMLLAFMPEQLAREMEVLPAQRSAALIKKYTHDLPNSGRKSDKIGFYKPEDSGEDEEDAES